MDSSYKKITRNFVPPNIFESWWLSLFEGNNPAVVLAAVTFISHQLFYYGRYVPFWIAEHIPACDKYKIQPNKPVTSALRWKCLKSVLIQNHFVQLPMILAFHPGAELLGMKITDPFPSLFQMAIQLMWFFLFEDFYHYWAHRLFHWGFFYKYIHKVHHEFTAPFGLAAEYAHPAETMLLAMGTFGGPLIWILCTGDLHVVTVLLWMTGRLIQAVDSHSGYDFPFSARHWCPIWSGADHHDYHHQFFVNNYASSFRIWDHLFGTDIKYKNYRKKQEAEKAKLSKKMK
ncbi:hypothetical protein K493DRAFT_323042 [Basidiobolus meristosporus CBS 931.73]|uniref:Fatty acid hydroxylase domain-containing protein n=1 Tax=Basidiobolus meristosporus CBS 931.73 TaxID=1314790 RepID=A0A1Y1Z0H8_9FUNG|nr:hypothetical protein K493DRAFT_323042 [Basidiobolus meristosporus CBS 931.73]|eukprot:ORY03790.1 hypothetical protein K493DRAFT_323042 [Basidiobolus meristosporus CBS 931.73]